MKVKQHFKYFIYLDKFFILISRRYSKGIFYLLNAAFGIFTGILCYYSLKNISENKSEIGVILFLVSIFLILIAELININSKNSFISIYTLNKLDIYPISQLEHIKNLFLSDLFNSRSIYYLSVFLMIMFFSANITAYFVLKSVLIFVLIYLISTAVFTLIDYGYAYLIKYFGEKAKYSFMLVFLLILATLNILDKLSINIDDYFNKPTNLINFLLNK